MVLATKWASAGEETGDEVAKMDLRDRERWKGLWEGLRSAISGFSWVRTTI